MYLSRALRFLPQKRVANVVSVVVLFWNVTNIDVVREDEKWLE